MEKKKLVFIALSKVTYKKFNILFLLKYIGVSDIKETNEIL